MWQACLVVFVFLVAGCHRVQSRSEVRAVILLTVANFRMDQLGTVGAADSLTPTLDRLAHRAVSFENATAVSAWPLPNLYALMASRYMESQQPTGAINGAQLGGSTLAALLAASGYETAVFGGGLNLAIRFGLVRGFNTSVHQPSETLSTLAPLAVDWLREHAVQKTFLWLQVMDLTQASRSHDLKAYRSALKDLDASLRGFLDLLKKADIPKEEIALIVTGDQGAALSQRETSRGLRPYDFWIRVPLIMYLPGSPARRVTEPVDLIDVAPTILELTGIAIPRSFQGASVLHAGISGTARTESFSCSPAESSSPLVYALRTPHWKLLYGEDGFELYDLQADPEEQINRAKADPETAFGLSQRLLHHWSQARMPSEQSNETVHLTSKMLKRLYEAGYW